VIPLSQKAMVNDAVVVAVGVVVDDEIFVILTLVDNAFAVKLGLDLCLKIFEEIIEAIIEVIVYDANDEEKKTTHH